MQLLSDYSSIRRFGIPLSGFNAQRSTIDAQHSIQRSGAERWALDVSLITRF
jgi:hypothetical protein